MARTVMLLIMFIMLRVSSDVMMSMLLCDALTTYNCISIEWSLWNLYRTFEFKFSNLHIGIVLPKFNLTFCIICAFAHYLMFNLYQIIEYKN